MSLPASLTMTVVNFVLETWSTKKISAASGSNLLHVLITRSRLSHHVNNDSFLVRGSMVASQFNGDRLASRYAQRNSR